MIQDPPFVIKVNNSWTGYCVDVFNLLIEKLQLKYKFVEQLDGNYGVLLPNNKWNGMIGELSKQVCL